MDKPAPQDGLGPAVCTLYLPMPVTVFAQISQTVDRFFPGSVLVSDPADGTIQTIYAPRDEVPT